MKNLILTTLSTILLLSSCGDGNTIGKYKKEPLPDGFSYKIIEDNSNATLEKNELLVEVNQKISIEQIATLADKLYASKPVQRRFYIFYRLPDMKFAWATSHFDPNLEVKILGSSTEQETKSKKIADSVDGEIIGKWHEEDFTSSNYIIYRKDKKTFIKTIFKNGQSADEELKEKKINSGTRYDYKEGGFNDEYFMLTTSGDLEFYNKEKKKFATATKLE